VRAMAVGDVAFADAWRVLRREIFVGLSIGVLMAAAMFLRAEMMRVPLPVSSVVAVAAVFIVVWAAAVAAVLPLLLRRIGVDPAVVSAPFITTLVDGTGLFIYLSLARWIIAAV